MSQDLVYGILAQMIKYHDKAMKMLAWNSVAVTMYTSWEQLSTAQKEEKGKIYLINVNKK